MSTRAFWVRAFRLAVLAALAMALVAIGTARAGFESAGTTAANFLSLGSGAHTLGMGGATLGLGDDLGGSAWNPAALGWLAGYEGAVSHAGLPNQTLQEWGGIGGRLGRTQTRWALSGLYQGDGSVQGRDATGAATGSFSVSSMALGATLAQQIGKVVTVGFAAKGVRENLASVSGSGVTFDTGIMLRAGPIGLGIAAQNWGGRMAYGSAIYSFPRSYGAGVAISHRGSGVRLALDANFPIAYHPDLRGGVEWAYKGALALRAGYRKEMGSDADPLGGPTFGLSAGHDGTWVDYGYLLVGDGPGQHRVGLRFQLGRLGPGGQALDERERPRDGEKASGASRDGRPPAPKR